MTRDLVPFRQFVLKVHSRCDLACDHCYIYEHTDQSWRGRPKDGMSPQTAGHAAHRIAEHAAAHRLAEVNVILHGGEPLLLGVRRTRGILETLRREIAPVTRLVLGMHTNAVLLSEDYLDLFAEYDLHVGVSLDGDRTANDLHRVDRRGRSSYDKVIGALELLRRPAYRHLYSGLLCTIDLRNDPVDAYRALAAQQPPRIDFLLPHATWEHQPFGLPARRDPATATRGPAPYAQWLGAVFDAWDQAGRPVPIRTFDSVLAALYGRPSGTESLGLVPADLLVIETDGALEQADWLKTTFDGAAATGFAVEHDTLDQAAAHAGIKARQHGLDDLCDTCRACPVVEVCGGGLYAHRYDPASGFDNPSVFCPDLLGLIGRISRVEGGRIPPRAAAAGAVSQDPKKHSLSRADFDDLAAGHGTGDAIRGMTDAQNSIRRELLAALAGAGPQEDRLFTDAWDRLAALDEVSMESVDWALAHPYVRVWAARCLQDPGAGRGIGHFSHLASVVASAYLAGDHTSNLTLPVHEGLLHIAGTGALRAAHGERESVVELRSGSLVVASADGRPREIALTEEGGDRLWQPVRWLEAEDMIVTFDDLDPYRDCHGDPAARLSSAAFDRWREAFPQAIAFIDEQMPRYAPALRAGLATVVPLELGLDGSHRGTTDRHAFGAVGATLPDDPALLALLLVRGFQQVKLGALFDLYDFYDTADTDRRYSVFGRPDPVSLSDLLFDAYTNTAVADFWLARRRTLSGEAAVAAEQNFIRRRLHMSAAVARLLDSRSLTTLGERFVRGIGETLDTTIKATT
ncbi:MAG TPA: FxsB family cyclophane-forming radical SAM/SPASM peptide maturase [Actinocrinis sp.]|nr:FxsB family cyclophane-forming radical SAM/SPASM peptide maturase [Actinocrinis sp.]